MKFSPKLKATEVDVVFRGKFTALQVIAEGGQGVVLKATPKAGGGPFAGDIALKIYFPGSHAERTRREVDALRRLRCASLVRLYDAGNVHLRGQSCMYVATEFVQGEVLSDIVARAPLSVDRAARIGCDIASAIDALWLERIVHRDIKPQNIMVTGGGRAFLIDLGVARHLALNAITTTGKTWGTEGYMSPEHARALRQLSCKSDVFALGIVLQECLLGRHPTGYNQFVLSSGGPRTATLVHGLPPALSGFVDLMVVSHPHLRPSPAQVTAALVPYC